MTTGPSKGELSHPSITSYETLIDTALRLGARDVTGWSKEETSLARTSEETKNSLRGIRDEIRSGADPLGTAFCQLRSSLTRRELGQTYTPKSIVDSMMQWADSETEAPQRIVDPGSGSGRFIVEAGRRFPKAQLMALDIDPLAAMMTRANLAAAGFAKRSTVLVQDFRSLQLASVRGTTLYIGNPPYVRHHQIAPPWKQWLYRAAKERGLEASGLAGLHAYFFLATAAGGSVGDRGAYITSAEWLDVNYGQLIRDLLLDGLGGVSIHVLDPDATPFSDAATTGVITTFKLGSRPKSIRLKRVQSVTDLGSLDGGRLVSRDRLKEARRWTPLIRSTPKLPEDWIELGELCRVHRGAVTGANSVWVTPAENTDLPSEVLFPSVTKARELFAAGVQLSSLTHLRCVIDLPADLDVFNEDQRKCVNRFLRYAKRQGVHDGYVAKNREAWWKVGLRNPAPILATYMARRPPAFVRNVAGARHINVAHGIYPRETMSNRVLDLLADALRKSVDVGQGRTYAGGLTKFEPREMERVPVPYVDILRVAG